MDKLKLAHDWYMKHSESASFMYTEVDQAWKYADAMQAEADKRNKAEAEQKRKEIREMLNAPNTFIEREGQHFDDVAGVCKTYSSSEWQPDWSQAPEWANWWAMDADSSANWLSDHPSSDPLKIRVWTAPSFKYQGNWQESLRKRPEPKFEVDWSQAPENAVAFLKLSDWDIPAWIDEHGIQIEDAPSFGFAGNHIVERPNGF